MCSSDLVEPGRPDARLPAQPDGIELLHEVAEHGALGAARGLRLLLQLVLEIGLAPGAHDDGPDVGLVLDAGDLVVGLEHVLVDEIADSEQVWVVADGHHGHDLAAVEEQRQRLLRDDGSIDAPPLVIEARHGDGQAGIVGRRADGEFLHGSLQHWWSARRVACDHIRLRDRAIRRLLRQTGRGFRAPSSTSQSPRSSVRAAERRASPPGRDARSERLDHDTRCRHSTGQGNDPSAGTDGLRGMRR